MRKPLIAGNWKMNTNLDEATNLVKAMLDELDGIDGVEKVLCPPFISLTTVKELIKDTSIELGAQNMYFEARGAYTGEISPLMLVDLCHFVILGHSERRRYFNETDETINKTVILMKIIKPTQLSVSKTMIFPGTDLYSLAKAQGIIEDNYWLTSKPPPYYTYEHSLKTLIKWAFRVSNYDKNKYQLTLLKIHQKIRKISKKTYALTFRKTLLAPIIKKNFSKFKQQKYLNFLL